MSAELTFDLQRRRIACFTYFFTIEYGWGRWRKITVGDKKIHICLESPPVCQMSRLGFMGHELMKKRFYLATKICKEETSAYKLAHKQLKEAAKRFQATRSEKAWLKYVLDWDPVEKKPGCNSVAFRTHIEKKRRNASDRFDNLQYRYRYYELLPRKQERARAKQEMREALDKLTLLRIKIFDRMQIPEKFRSFVLNFDL